MVCLLWIFYVASRLILFFFQAEDGIRDWSVTGVQTCALPIFAAKLPWTSSCLVRAMAARHLLHRRGLPCTLYLGVNRDQPPLRAHAWLRSGVVCVKIGRASCRERGEIWGCASGVQNNTEQERM